MASPLTPLPARGSGGFSNLAKPEPDGEIFEAPHDLICPITQNVFLDPVLTQAGHSYERRAIEQYLLQSNTDPMSREVLQTKSLTPVFVLKSKAAEYREKTARKCIEMACSPFPARPPITYLRRAVELCADAEYMPQGLTPQVVNYVITHPSNAYDRLALELFARGLYEGGYKDRAASVYFHLLSTSDDRTAQAEMLRRCLTCWQSDSDFMVVSSTSRNTNSVHVDAHAFEKLVQLMDRTASFAWLIDVSAEAGLGHAFVARLCEQILFPTAPSSAAEMPEPLPWSTEKEVLLKYTFVLTSELRDEAKSVTRRLEELEERVQPPRRVSSSATNTSVGRLGRNNVELLEGSSIGEFWEAVRGTLTHPWVLLPCAVVAALGHGGGGNPIVKVAVVLPYLALVNKP